MRLIYTFASMRLLNFKKAHIQNIDTEKGKNAVALSMLRLDVLHEYISGNKWFKLLFYLQEAKHLKAKSIATFGGAFSNHIVATASACNEAKIDCIIYVRGEEPNHYSSTLLQAKQFNAQLIFLSRNKYDQSKKQAGLFNQTYFIPEGGSGNLGVKGAATIYSTYKLEDYDYILAACGTGTTIAGILTHALPHQTIIGISVLKGYESLEQEILELTENVKANFKLLNEFHFGGYAKYNHQLIDFMNGFYKQQNIPTDFVYTAKLCFAAETLLQENYFKPNSKVLLIHTGGLQGNMGLKNKKGCSSLIF